MSLAKLNNITTLSLRRHLVHPSSPPPLERCRPEEIGVSNSARMDSVGALEILRVFSEKPSCIMATMVCCLFGVET
jgi:hypothetical protein